MIPINKSGTAGNVHLSFAPLSPLSLAPGCERQEDSSSVHNENDQTMTLYDSYRLQRLRLEQLDIHLCDFSFFC